METPPNALPPPSAGSQMVSEALGASPRHLSQLHTPDSPADVLAQLVFMAARHLDQLHKEFADAAQYAAANLTRAATGKTSINSLGILQNSATQIDILAARRADAIDHLKVLIHAYRQVTTAGHATPRPAHRPTAAPYLPEAAGAAPNRPTPSR
ncbi:hypothetical protein [Streptomyces huasconensis]|uniref:hypothetical protein n=1 Tax=Streptomyces huasconensis TaxID=1854574 RepID=UPI0033E51ACC